MKRLAIGAGKVAIGAVAVVLFVPVIVPALVVCTFFGIGMGKGV